MGNQALCNCQFEQAAADIPKKASPVSPVQCHLLSQRPAYHLPTCLVAQARYLLHTNTLSSRRRMAPTGCSCRDSARLDGCVAAEAH